MSRRLSILILLFGLAACDSVLEPEDVQGEFVLQSTPVTLQRDFGTHQILADTLRISSDGSAVRIVSQSIVTEAGHYVGTWVEEYRYSIRRGTVRFAFVCPINALMLCTPPPHIWGAPTKTGLSLRLAEDPRTRLEYERVRNVRDD